VTGSTPNIDPKETGPSQEPAKSVHPTLWCAHAGKIDIRGDIISPIDDPWEADANSPASAA
jgi:hypothetical protein